ncbi:hypothetical protein AYO38_03455 [bacterium SCGC AG-212-C10]|nr:hypothetical protein AYO38_03455 [bacterium SCGC AG-212-C10]
MAECDQRLKYVHTTKVGLSSAYNRGIAECDGDIIAFTDDDCIVPTDWLKTIAEAFARHPKAGLLYGQVLVPPELQGAGGVVPSLVFDSPRTLSAKTEFEVFGMGANFAARRSLLQQIGGFDEVLGGGGPLRSSQDFDLQYRVYRTGQASLLEPSVRLLHYGFRDNADWPRTLTAYGVGDGGFYMKHLRCGDPTAGMLLGRKIAGQAIRVILKPLVGRRHSTHYLRGMIAGARKSFEYDVDSRRRMYRQKQQGA